MPDEKTTAGLTVSKLYRCPLDGAKDISALEAVNRLSDGHLPFYLAYTPDFCGFVSCQDGKLSSLDGESIAPETLFELRCFCKDFDLHWVRKAADGTGNGVLFSENPIEGWKQEPVIEQTKDGKNEPVKFLKRSGRYLLWGKGTERGDRVRLFEHRIGELPVPAEIEEKLNRGDHVWLSFDEYFSPDEYGNMVWRLERLKGLNVD